MNKKEIKESSIDSILGVMTSYAKQNFIDELSVEDVGLVKFSRDRVDSPYPTQTIEIIWDEHNDYYVEIERYWSPPAVIKQRIGGNDDWWKNLSEIKSMLNKINNELKRVIKAKSKEELEQEKEDKKKELKEALKSLK